MALFPILPSQSSHFTKAFRWPLTVTAGLHVVVWPPTPRLNRQHDRNCRYLDYIEEKKDIGMIIRLYERCLVACASYPGMLRD